MHFTVAAGSNFDAEALYLFIMGKSDKENLTGDMPRGKQFGYLFEETALQGKEDAVYRTIAHEISHGVFSLSHTFDTQYQIPQASTSNLMDYSGGTKLVKHQWDAIHAPGIVIGMFERDEDAAMSLPCLGWFDDCKDVKQILETIRETRIKGNLVKVNGQTKTDQMVISANSLKIADTDFSNIKLVYTPKKEAYTFDPLTYMSVNESVLNGEGKVENEKGFTFRKDGKEVFRIVVDDEDEKIEKLRVYLFGIPGTYNSITRMFANKTELTPGEISIVREQIASLKDVKTKGRIISKTSGKRYLIIINATMTRNNLFQTECVTLLLKQCVLNIWELAALNQEFNLKII